MANGKNPNPESHYHLSKLHVIFAIVALVLLASVGGLLMNDYNREWKKYQADFRTLDIEKTRIKQDLARQKMEEDPEYKTLADDIKKAQDEYSKNCPDSPKTEAEIKKLNTQYELVIQKYRFAKAGLDALRYQYEEAISHKSKNLSTLKKNYEDLERKTNDLNLKVQSFENQIKAQKSKIDTCRAQLKELERKERSLRSQLTIFERKLKKIDPIERRFINNIADYVRDLPIIDLANPNYKIEQIVLKDIKDDVNFMQLPKVERCTTCHLGIANPDYKNAGQPFKSHPNLELFLDNNSPHPLEEFGCTTCHGGRGRGTSFSSAAHTPSSKEQEEEWIKKYQWKEIHHWENPMLPTQYVEAGCFKCHSGETAIKGADKLNLGLQLIERSGCYNCHTIDKYKDWPKTGPGLEHVASKLSKEWAYRWIENPRSFRADTWMPSYFNQSNNNDPQSIKRSEQEILAMVEFLFANSEKFKPMPVPFAGDAARGEELVSSLGCFACHEVKNEKKDESATTKEALYKQFGPNLAGMGSKAAKDWIYTWVKDPKGYHPATRMPDFRLSDQEAVDIAEYLAKDLNQEFEQRAIPALNEEILDRIAFDFLTKVESNETAKAKIAQMPLKDKQLFAGEKLISHYGCFSCHTIKGFENAKPIGAELTEEGSKPASKLDFGFIHMEHKNYAWFEQKLHDPRSFDHGKVKEPLDKLIMPNFYLSKDEIEAISTAILGFVSDKTVKDKIKPRTPENLALEEGAKIIRQMNCQSCHIIEGQGGSLQADVKDWLVKYQGKEPSEANAIVASFSPPNLIGEGQKVQSEWLFEFLHQPTTIRPWLKVRMPTYGFNAAHLNALVKYFNVLDNEEFPFTDKVNVQMTDDELQAAQKLFSNEYFGCAQCHIVGDKMPSGSAENWAPDFGLAKTRLKPEWIIEWLKDPAALLPGTKMPTYFDPKSFHESGPPDILEGDENAQIRVLRNYLMTISEHPAPAPAAAAPVTPAPAAVEEVVEETPAAVTAEPESIPAPVEEKKSDSKKSSKKK